MNNLLGTVIHISKNNRDKHNWSQDSIISRSVCFHLRIISRMSSTPGLVHVIFLLFSALLYFNTFAVCAGLLYIFSPNHFLDTKNTIVSRLSTCAALLRLQFHFHTFIFLFSQIQRQLLPPRPCQLRKHIGSEVTWEYYKRVRGARCQERGCSG